MSDVPHSVSISTNVSMNHTVHRQLLELIHAFLCTQKSKVLFTVKKTGLCKSLHDNKSPLYQVVTEGDIDQMLVHRIVTSKTGFEEDRRLRCVRCGQFYEDQTAGLTKEHFRLSSKISLFYLFEVCSADSVNSLYCSSQRRK